MEPVEDTFVVIEGSAACPSWMGHWGDEPECGFSALEQEAWESPASFRARLEECLERRAAFDSSTLTVLLVVGEPGQAEQVTERWKVAVALLAHLLPGGRGRLLLTTGHGSALGTEAELRALAADLNEEWSWSGLAVHLALDEVPPVSRVRQTVPPIHRVRPLPAPALVAHG